MSYNTFHEVEMTLIASKHQVTLAITDPALPKPTSPNVPG